MNKSLVLAAGLAILATSSFAQTQVLSRNAVGYVKIDAVRSNFYYIANNFFSLDGANVPITVTNLLGQQVPAGTLVNVWDPVAQTYRPENKIGTAWFPGTNRLFPGRGFWIKIPNNAPSNSYAVYLMGEVPDKNTLPTNTATVLPGFNAIANPYPTSMRFTNSVVAKSGVAGDIAIFWNPNNQTYGGQENRIGSTWFPGTNMLIPGQGFWYKSIRSTNFTWIEPKPYTWP